MSKGHYYITGHRFILCPACAYIHGEDVKIGTKKLHYSRNISERTKTEKKRGDFVNCGLCKRVIIEFGAYTLNPFKLIQGGAA